MPATTGNFSSIELLGHEEACRFDVIDSAVAQTIGERFAEVGLKREHPITIVIQLDGIEVFKRALPGADDEQIGWITRKARVVNLTHHSTMYERVSAEEAGINWHEKHGVEDATHAIHGGGFPLVTTAGEFKGVVLVSGLPQVDDHMLAYETLATLRHELAQG
jgi:uncharacterized protein (UPF0303 family)